MQKKEKRIFTGNEIHIRKDTEVFTERNCMIPIIAIFRQPSENKYDVENANKSDDKGFKLI